MTRVWKFIPVLSFAALLAGPDPSNAQQAVVSKYEIQCPNQSKTTKCFFNVGAATPVLGYQQISSGTLVAATKLTVPTGATTALVIPTGSNGTNGACVEWQDDGGVPTTVTGMPLAALVPLTYAATALTTNLQFIQAGGATCTLNVTYYK